MWDGDTIFSLSRGELQADINTVGLMAAEAMENAVRRAIFTATTLSDIPALNDLASR